MPKPGKKKGQKQEAPKEEPPKQEPSKVEEEEDVGLGLGGASKRKQKKEKSQQMYEAARQASTSQQASTSREASQTPKPDHESKKAEDPKQIPGQIAEKAEDEDVGLGLGVGSKRKQKKGKSQQVSSDQASSSREQSQAPEEPPKPIVEEITSKVEEVAEDLDGLGLGGAKRKRPKKKKADAAPATMVAAASAGEPAAALEPKATQSYQQIPFTPHPPPGFAPPSASSALPAHSQGWGRGKGRGYPGSAPTVNLPSVGAPSAVPPSAMSSQTPQTPYQPFPQQQTQTYQGPPQQQQQISRPQTSQPQIPKGQFAPASNILCRYKIPAKVPGGHVNGRRIIVVTNYLEMNFKPLSISRYDVSFTPDRPKKMLTQVFKLVKREYFPNEITAFDQVKNCYSLNPLPNFTQGRLNTSVEINDSNGKLMKFEVSIKATGVVELGKIKRHMAERGTSLMQPTEEIQCIDVILRQGTLETYVKAGRQFFKRPTNPVDLGHGFEMWTGLFQSAIFTNRAFINIDVAHKGFPKQQSMIDALKDFNLRADMPIEKQRSYEIDNYLQFIKGLKVVAHLVGNAPSSGQKREFICNGLVDPPGKQKFILTDSAGKQREITVADYFAREKQYRLKFPNLNCVWVGPKDKNIYFPMELLEVAYGQPLARQLDDTQISKMVKEAATPPDRRLQKIIEVISSMNYSRNADFKKFGLEISDKFFEVNAKILEPPSLDIGRGSVIPRNGVWQANSLLKAQALTSWGFIAIETQPNTDFNSVVHMIMSTAKQIGMQVAEPKLRRYDVTLTSLNSVLRGALDNGINLVFVVVSMRGRDHYHKVKQMAEREVGMLTQCIKEATARRMNPMTARNILLKVNSKLMGINQALGDKTLPRCLRDGGVMVVGADVTHPSPDQANIPSIAAVTASIDPKCFSYNIELSIQTPKKEIIVEFEDMILDHLRVYRDRNGQLPRKIFVFRDGVSEGQFAQVMNSELTAVHTAYQRMAGAGKKPEILFLLVQKRHHTRFFNRGDYCKYNVEPGTVVDTEIVHPAELDFYLVSHQAIKGTARPTRYHAVCNDGRIPDDEVEQLTYYLCHLYSRCMRSVSYPAPTYYAHLACLRAKSLTYGQKFNNKDLETRPQRLHVLDKMLQTSRMFYV